MANRMKVSAVPGYRVPNFDVMAQGVPAFLADGEVIEVSSRSPEWRAELAAGVVKPECSEAAKYAPRPPAPVKQKAAV